MAKRRGNSDTVRPTRYSPVLGYVRRDRALWRVVYTDEEGTQSDTGPHYSSKAELLGDLARFATENYGLM
jgi:hypothetical protein